MSRASRVAAALLLAAAGGAAAAAPPPLPAPPPPAAPAGAPEAPASPAPTAPPPPPAAAAAIPPLALESFALPNGLSVILAPDHRLPRVVVDTWFDVGSKDEAPGRSGFAHLFEHLMFMGTERVPGNQFDLIMEAGGGSNNASTSEDRTAFYAIGPPSLLPTLLWLDADRFSSLPASMTQAKLDLQRAVVLNERRQTVENTPYGIADLIIPEAMYPEDHPYHHPVIGSPHDLEAARVPEVVEWFGERYVPAAASLVIAGDFDPAAVRPLVEQLFAAVPARPWSPMVRPPPTWLAAEVRRVAVDRVELPRLELVWHAPPAYAPGTAELDLLARILGEGPSSRLARRLVLELQLAGSVEVYLEQRALGSLFHVEITGVAGADLGRVKREALAVLAQLAATGPTAAELERARARQEADLRAAREDLLHRADRLDEYRFYLGTPDGFALDLARHAACTVGTVQAAARTLGPGRLDLRILPQGAPAPLPRAHPADLPAGRLAPPTPLTWRLASGVEVRAIPLPGSGLFSGAVLFTGAGRAVPPDRAGATALLARLLVSGAGGRSAAAFDEAVTALGGEIDARAGAGSLTVSVRGLARNLEPTLDLLADAVERPALAPADFARERDRLLDQVEARADDPHQVAALVGAAQLFGPDDPRGRPADGYTDTVPAITLPELTRLAGSILHPAAATIVLAGDFDPAALHAALERRFGAWTAAGAPPPPPPAPRATPAPGAPARRVVLVDRPGAPQTEILGVRLLAPLEGTARTARRIADVALGGSFTSRLNLDLRERHGYTYGARSGIRERDGQALLTVSTAVQREVTGPAIAALRADLDGLARGLPPAEAAKARATARSDLVATLATADALAAELADELLAGRPAGALAEEAAALDAAGDPAVSAAAATGAFGFDGLSLVLVGDRRAVLPQLRAAGLPAPVLLDAQGRPAPP